MRVSRLLLWAMCCLAVSYGAVRGVAQQVPPSLYNEMRWRMIGPFRGGRTRAVAGVPGHPAALYMGQVNGGVWKSQDYGRTWKPIFDGQPTQSVGAIAIAPSNPDIIYVASGEGLHRPDLSVGDGIYKSSDGGKTFTHLGLRDGQQIPALVVDPRDPNRLFAAVLGHPYGPSAARGIFRSRDGGSTWEKVLAKDENTGGSDIVLDPSNPDVLYAGLWEVREGPWEDNNEFQGTGGGLFKSSDGGNTWRQLTKGLPKNLTQIGIAVAPSRPNRLYGIVATTDKGDYASGAGLGVFRSDDAGESWGRATTDPRPAMRIGGGDLPMLRVDPNNPEVVYSTSLVTLRSRDGGQSWTSIRGAPGGDDYQNIWIDPEDSNVILLVSDQGAIVSVNGGETWSSWYNQPTAQLYHVSVSNEFPYRVCGGQQESGSVCILSRGNDGRITFRDWHPVGTIEYGYVAPDPLDHDTVYGAGRFEVSKFHWSTGQVQNITPVPVRSGKFRANRTQPLLFSPIDPHTLYYTTNVLFKTMDGGANWQAISPDLTRPNPGPPPSVGSMISKNPASAKQRGVIYALAPSFKNVNTIWAGTDDGLVWITRDGGQNWANITPPQLTPWSKVTQISASHYDDNTAYVSVSRFRIDDLRPYIYRTHDAGKNWQLITAGIAEQGPADTVREDPARQGLLFAGTENAVWVSFNDGDRWQSLQLNLPHTSMRDLWIADNDLIVATHGRSFWILDDLAPLREVSAATANEKAHLFRPADVYRVRRDTNTDTPLPADEPAGQNPPEGALIDYFLGEPASGTVTIEILDGEGKLVRRYSSGDQPERTEAELKRQLIPLYWVREPKSLASAAGMHRWVWDLRYPSPAAAHRAYPIAAVPYDTPLVPQGPLVLPGTYMVRLTANGQSYTAPLTVKMDPRVNTAAAGLRQQFELATRLASMLAGSSEALLQAKSLRQQAQKLSSGHAPVAALKALDQTLAELLSAGDESGAGADAPKPSLTRVNGHIATLYAAVEQADAAPTPAQASAAAVAQRDLAALMERWNVIKVRDLPAVNTQLHGAGSPELHLEAAPQPEQEGGDEK
jgi:photosystem II stability/assembly factor-like uncharacterized protein